jgi:hypothetical protein
LENESYTGRNEASSLHVPIRFDINKFTEYVVTDGGIAIMQNPLVVPNI